MSEANLVEVDQGDLATKVKVIWCLYLAAVLFGLTAIVGVVLAYVWRGDLPEQNPFRTHFDGQITLFWMTLLFVIIGAFLNLVFIGPLVLLATCIYFLVTCIIGLVKAIDNRPYK